MPTECHKKMLIVTNLELWSMSTQTQVATGGNQSLYSTLLGWARHGWEVHVLTAAQRLKGKPVLPGNIHVHRHRPPGRWLVRLLRGLRDRFRARAHAAAGASVAPQRPRAPAAGPRAPAIERRRHYVAMVYLWIGLWALWLHLRHRFDLFYGYETYGAPVAWFWSKVFRRPLVTRFQGTLMSRFLDRPEMMCRLWEATMPMRLRSDLLIMTNDGTQGDKVLARLGVPKDRYVFWRNGVAFADEVGPDFDAQAFRMANGIGSETVLLTSASRMVEWKRIDRMVQAAARIDPELDFRLVLIGDGETRPALQRLVADKGLRGRVTLAGALPHRAVIQWHRAADVLMSTFDVSNVGNQLLEAQRLGKPYVSIDTGDTADILVDGVNGLLVSDPDDIAGLAAAMTRMITEPELRERCGRGALEVGRREVCSWQERMDREVAVVTERVGLTDG